MTTFEEQLEEATVVAQLRARINSLTVGAPPSGVAGGKLAGSYPNPTFAAGAVVDADVNAAAAIAESKLALATDAAAGIGSRRTLGTGALQATAGNDARLSDARAPTGPAGGDLSGTYPSPAIKTVGAHQVVAAQATNVNIAAPGPSIGGIGPGAGDRILLTGQTTVAQNGVWVYNGSAVALTRPTDWNTGDAKGAGQLVSVGQGIFGGRLAVSTVGAFIGTDDPVFAYVSANGAAGGDLTGSYPSPTIAALAVTDAKVAVANKDGATGTPSMRTLGTGALQAVAGNDSRLSDSRAPNGAAGGDLGGTYPNPTVRNPRAHAVHAAETANVNLAAPGTGLGGLGMVAGDRVVLLGQTTTTQNGIWVWNGAAVAMTRPADWASGDAKTAGEAVVVGNGTLAGRAYALPDNIVVDTNGFAFTVVTVPPAGAAGGDLGGSYPNPTVLLAGDGILLARTVNTMSAVAPLDGSVTGLNGSVNVRQKALARVVKASIIGDGATTVWALTHGLSTWQPTVTCVDNTTGLPIELDWVDVTVNQISVTISPALAAGAIYLVNVIG